MNYGFYYGFTITIITDDGYGAIWMQMAVQYVQQLTWLSYVYIIFQSPNISGAL